ncbi:hypothetical protein BGZ75_000622 [Mortierella antarctica]|nr:hypothetical protein BGZ75_000622 [Mortierella antarctica]
MHQHYLAKLPIGFARGMAGFKDRPYHVPRNELVPPIELQKKIFPWIEEAMGQPDSRERRLWEKQCLEEMTDTETHRTVDRMDITHYKDAASEAVLENHEDESAIAKAKFLKLLVYLRRVILQDAVAHLSHYRWEGPVLGGDLFNTDDLFLAFKKDLGARLSARVEQEFAPEVHPAVVNAIQDGSVLLRDEVSLNAQEQRKAFTDLRSQMSQLQHVVHAQAADFARIVQQLLQQVLPVAGASRQVPYPSHIPIQRAPNGEGSSSSSSQMQPMSSSRAPPRQRQRQNQPQPQPQPQPQMPEIQEPHYRYNHTTATSVYWECVENQRREQLIKERKAMDKTFGRLPVDNKDLAQKSARKKIFEEVLFLASTRTIGSQEERITGALAELDALVALNFWSTHQLFKRCRYNQEVRKAQEEAEKQRQRHENENNNNEEE